jgi:hypothetical protein
VTEKVKAGTTAFILQSEHYLLRTVDRHPLASVGTLVLGLPALGVRDQHRCQNCWDSMLCHQALRNSATDLLPITELDTSGDDANEEYKCPRSQRSRGRNRPRES